MKTKTHILLLLAIALTLAACAPGEPVALEDTSWTLVSYGDQTPLEGTRITAIFKDGTVGGNAGCNGYNGRYRLNGNRIEVSSLMSTLMYCEIETMDQETLYLALLQNAQNARIENGQLILERPDGPTLVFEPAE